MKTIFICCVIAWAVVVGPGCVPQPQWPAALLLDSSEQIRSAAAQDALRDIAAGKPRICFAGVGKVQAVGVPPEHLHLVADLPRVPLPTGVNSPQSPVIRAYVYAEAYNRQILQYLLQQQGQ